VSGLPPLVSCLVVTQPGRQHLLAEALDGFSRQTWPRRELVIVSDGTEGDRAALDDLLAGLGVADARVVWVASGTDLGTKRNRSIDAARGDLVCQWDDDDLHHPERIAAQVERLLADEADACFLGDALQWLADEDRLFHLEFARGTGAGRMLHGTLLLRRDRPYRYPERGGFARSGEDTDLVTQVLERGRATVVRGRPELYVYRIHGANTVSALHAARLAARLAVDPTPVVAAAAQAALARVGRTAAFGTAADAAARYDAVLDASPPDLPEVLAARGDQARQARRFDEAIDLYRRAVAGRPDDPFLRFSLAMCLSADAPAEARPHLLHAVEVWPRFREALVAIGELSLGDDDMPAALAWFERALALGEPTSALLNNLGVALAGVGRPDEALARFRDAVVADPADTVAHANLHGALGDRPDALYEWYAAATAAHPTRWELPWQHGVVLARAGRHAQALQAFEEAARRAPTKAMPWVEAARVHLALGAPRRAVAMARQAAVVEPSDPWPHVVLARVAYALGQPTEGADRLRVAADLARQGHEAGRDFTDVGLVAGRLALDAGARPLAREILEQTRRLQPRSERVAALLARAAG